MADRLKDKYIIMYSYIKNKEWNYKCKKNFLFRYNCNWRP